MKHLTKFVLAIACMLCVSCQKQAQKDAAKTSTKVETKSEVVKATPVATPEKSSTDKIVGKYYVYSFYDFLKTGLILKTKVPEKEYASYTFDFKEDGSIRFKDINKMPGCGNGVLHMHKASWKVNEKGIYTIKAKGEYALESRFNAEAEYTFKRLKNGIIYLKLHKIISNKKYENWDEEF